jgi:putative ABC transport system substrate-binding protein
MDRRRFLAGTSAVLLAAPLAAEGQEAGKVYRIGFLSPSSPSDPEKLASPFGERGLAAFRQGLRELGYVEGQNITIEHRWAEGKFERLPDLAAELVRFKVDVIVSVVTQATLAAKNATRTIPIVMVATGDPLGSGLVANLARPGGNVTGPSAMYAELAGKQLELLTKTVPKVSRVAVLWNPANAVWQAQMLRQTEGAARALGLQLQLLEARGPPRYIHAHPMPRAILLLSLPIRCHTFPFTLPYADLPLHCVLTREAVIHRLGLQVGHRPPAGLTII